MRRALWARRLYPERARARQGPHRLRGQRPPRIRFPASWPPGARSSSPGPWPRPSGP